MNEKIRTLMNELRTELVRVYGRRFKGIYLYGSYARGEQDRESDVDILIILDHIDQYGAEIDRTGPLVSALSLKYSVSISRVFVSEQDWLERDTPFLANAREEAIPA
jgi:predicted nucleotidyltransferase